MSQSYKYQVIEAFQALLTIQNQKLFRPHIYMDHKKDFVHIFSKQDGSSTNLNFDLSSNLTKICEKRHIIL